MSRVSSLGVPALLGAGLFVAACTSVLGIDGDYVVESQGGSTGGKGTGGARTGGTSSAGGGGTSTGGTAAGGAAGGGASGCGTAGACGAGTKCCSGACIAPAPLVGCGYSDCTRCPAPPTDGVAVCQGTTCSFECNSGFAPDGGTCQAVGTGGATGSGGGTSTGGTTATCVASGCPGCPPVGPFGCCKSNNTCGCTWAPGAVCY